MPEACLMKSYQRRSAIFIIVTSSPKVLLTLSSYKKNLISEIIDFYFVPKVEDKDLRCYYKNGIEIEKTKQEFNKQVKVKDTLEDEFEDLIDSYLKILKT
ncbi:8445_t:CDS:1 [Cetraspora pellucida]|uniref:8445_t:CDS:1 n=1 Tax=Cetraspora pellucida TaxID=1433469 RepID=A0ACA9JWT3_9GLOM|nr:8445_t:CDS:1 [Cetraspora pellucida]